MSNSPSTETILWKGHTSQWVNVKFYALCALLAVACIVGAFFTVGLAALGLVVPLVATAVRWWITKCTVFELTTERLRITSGVLNRHEEVIELYRVRDYTLEQPFLLRLFSLGNITLVTSDSTSPNLTISAISGAVGVRDQLRSTVEAARDKKRVRQMDVESTDGGSLEHDHHH